MKETTYLYMDGSGVVGPISETEVQALFTEGRLNRDSIVCSAEDHRWKKLEEFPTIAGVQKSAKSRGVYIILGIFFGLLGIHNFYAGHYRRGVWELIVTLLLGFTVIVPIGVAIWAVIELITIKTDGEGGLMSL